MAPTAGADTLKVAPMSDGCCIRVEGRATMAESPSAEAVAHRTLQADPNARVIFDLSSCEYLDSTFLGCLVHLYREQPRGQNPRFLIAAPHPKLRKILSACHLDRVLPILETAPSVAGARVSIPNAPVGTRDLARHIMECHKLLAELDSPMRPAFAKIAEQLQRELSATGA